MKRLLVITAITILQAGCATIISGRHQEVQVISSPHGAKACTSGQCVTTPGAFTLRRDTNHTVVVEKDGHLPETVTVTSGMGGAIAGNLILGGLIGGGVDLASGAAYKLYPETVNVALRPMPKGDDSLPSVSTELAPSEEKPVEAAPQPVARRAKLYPEGEVKIGGGSMSGRDIVLSAEYIDSGEGQGKTRIVYLNNQLLEGSYITINPGQAFDGLLNPKLIDPETALMYPVSSYRGFASVAGHGDTRIECIHAQDAGTCVDNYGNRFRLAF